MSKTVIITPEIVAHVAELANIPISTDEEKKFARAFTDTMQVVDTLAKVNTTNVEPTHQVTGLTNVLREDVVIETQMFTQEQALAYAHEVVDGFFAVPQIREEK